MRNSNFILMLLVAAAFSSCNTFKQATASHNTSSSNQATSSINPSFINSISVTPGQPLKEKATPVKKDIQKAVAAKPVAGSVDVFKSDNYSPAISNIENSAHLFFKYAILMDVNVEALQGNSKLFNFIDNWYGTRYRYGGTSRDGIDCSGFTGLLMSVVFGIKVPRTARDQYKDCDKVTKDDLQTGDLVFFNTRGGVSHVGVYLGNDRFVHSSTNSGVVISSLNESYYSRKFIIGGRPRGDM